MKNARSLFGNFYILCLFIGLLSFTSSLVRADLVDFSKLVEAVSPSVVNISVMGAAPEQYDGSEDMPHAMPWEEFFRRYIEPVPPVPRSYAGSGFIISEDGEIITNYHVVRDMSDILVKLHDHRELSGELIGYDKASDIALLKVEADDLIPVAIGSSKDLKVGQWVVAIGSPFGFEYTVTAGIVSAKGRSLPSESYVPFIQTDVAINPGSSGGPLFNLQREVIGVNAQIYTRTSSYAGLSFAVPIDLVINVVQQLKEKGSVSRGWLGVYIQEMTRELSQSFGIKDRVGMGALVSKVIEDSPAEDAEIIAGDVILEFDGVAINDSSELPQLVGQTKVGKQVKVEIFRNEDVKNITVTIGKLPGDDDDVEKGDSKEELPREVLGLRLSELSDKEREESGFERGTLLVEQVSQGAANRAGIIEGDILIMINNEHFETVDEFNDIVEDLPVGQFVTLLIVRNGEPRFLALKKEQDTEE